MKNRRVMGALVLGVALVISAVVFDMRSPNTSSTQAAAIVATTERVTKTIEDTDGDGIPDWEERIIGTDPSTPNERPSTTPSTGITEEDVESIPDTVTTRFAHSIFGNYLTERLSRNEIPSPEEQDHIILEASEYAKGYIADRKFSAADIYTIPSNDIESFTRYGNQIAQALQKYPDSTENELFILKRALDSGNEEELLALDSKIRAYKESVDEVRATPAPSELKETHLNLLNALLTLHNTIYTMRQAFEDPVAALIRSRDYYTHVEDLGNSIKNTTQALEQRGVVYGESDPGNFLLTLTTLTE